MSAYLDHAATTPARPEVVAAMAEELGRIGNPSSLHTAGRAARRVVEEAREQVAAALGARPGEVVITGGGTEADNLAVKGLYWARRAADPRRRRVLVSAVEHHGVLDPAEWLAHEQGAEVVHLPVDATGRLDVAALRAELEADPASVALVSVMWANNEVGTLQPVAEVVAAAAEHGVPVHSDAVQAVGAVPVDFDASGVAALSTTAHKIGGPVGVGALVVRRGTALVPVLHGGGQEGGVRSGSVAAASARALGLAAELAAADQPAHAARLADLRERLAAAVLAAVPDAVVHGSPDPALRLPGLLHVTVPGCQGDSLLYLLDARGVECSTGSACTAGVPQPSHVLRAMGLEDATARGALRFSLGRTSTAADVDAVAAALGPVVERARSAGLAVQR
ncbi:cysteine desulfurase family protein [Quadrisphaera sp. DSM 44207]|uniref:cysteine desulfurase family protein n=1 Tax=Quadrisphaera sp. DSM 44207 TaxID=1881057 RepID=UPI0008892FBB|nr:cysteine desulfurase family protein [Quadrisphaera sp. DSM 44207]SDQ74218.1 cysteine desulfurase [Quadrisphaera sp. DSM 44207]